MNKELDEAIDCLQDVWVHFSSLHIANGRIASRSDFGLSILEDCYYVLQKHKRINKKGLTRHDQARKSSTPSVRR